MVGSIQSSARLARRPSGRTVARELQEVSTPELAAELYQRLCVGLDGRPGPYQGTMLALYLESLLEEPKAQGVAAAAAKGTGTSAARAQEGS